MLLLVVALLVLMAIGVPVAFAIGMSAAVYVLTASSLKPVVLAQMTVSGADNFILLAVPFFILAGELMNQGGITRRLIAFTESIVGSTRGGLAYVVVIVNIFMAWVSGVAIADAAAVGSVTIPSMIKAGYRRGFAGAINAAAATIGPVIPPSVGFIIYASLSNVSVGKLFLAGAVPGVIMGLYLMVACGIIAHRSGLPRGEKTSLRKFLKGLKEAFWALLMPVIILGGILGGIVTATEAAAMAVLYGLVVGMFVYREIHWRDIPYLLAKAAKQATLVLFIIASAKVFGWLLAHMGAPGRLTDFFGTISDNPWVFLLIINVVILALGCFMEGGSIMVILTPLLLPVLFRYNIDPVHFGVVFQLNIMIGLLTPPVGMLLFVIRGVSGIPLDEILRDLWVFLVALVLVLLLVTLVPDISMFLPRLMART